MKVLLIDNGTSLLDKLQELIPGIEIIKKWNNILDSDLNYFDLVILSGSSNSSVVWQHEDFKDEINLIRSSKVPLIGICFGSELIAYSFGGSLRELTTRHKGIRSINIVDDFGFHKPVISVYENHRWIIDKMPQEFSVLAKSDDGPEAIKHINLPIYGLQFHPENFVDITEGDEFFLGILSKFSTDKKS